MPRNCRGTSRYSPPTDMLDSDLARYPESADSQTGDEYDYWSVLSVRTILPMILTCDSIET